MPTASTPTSPKSVDAAVIISAIWAKNALRREVGLPLWPVRETFERELALARWRVHVDANYASARAGVLAELLARHGERFGNSAGGRWTIEARTTKALRACFHPD